MCTTTNRAARTARTLMLVTGLLAGASAACQRESAKPARAATRTDERHVVVLADSTTVIGQRSSLIGLSARGERQWQLHLEGGGLAGPPAAAADSRIYARVQNALHRVEPTGDLVWTVPLSPPAAAHHSLWGPVPMTDSSVVVMASPTQVRAIDREGRDRWTAEVPQGEVVSRPVVGPNGNVIVQTRERLFAFSADGEPVFSQALKAAPTPVVGKQAGAVPQQR